MTLRLLICKFVLNAHALKILKPITSVINAELCEINIYHLLIQVNLYNEDLISYKNEKVDNIGK